MSLDIAYREREGIVVIDLQGRITAGDEATNFRAAIENVTTNTSAMMILNMQGVDYLDSTGLGSLAMCAGRVRSADGIVKLLHVNRRNIELMLMTKILSNFELFDDENDAVNSFFPGRELKRSDIFAFVPQLRDK